MNQQKVVFKSFRFLRVLQHLKSLKRYEFLLLRQFFGFFLPLPAAKKLVMSASIT